MTIDLCLTDRHGEAHMLAGVRQGEFVVLAATELTDDLRRLVTHLAEQGVPSRRERHADGAITVVEEQVTADHPLFIRSAAEAIRTRAHAVITFEEPRARAWFHLRTMRFEDETLRQLLLVSLPNLGEQEVNNLLNELENTAAELAAIDRRLDEALTKIRETAD